VADDIWLIAFDPGKTTGVCEFTRQGKAIDYHQLSLDELDEYVIEKRKVQTIGVIVYEIYRPYPGTEAIHMLKENPTEQAIGAILLLARRTNATIVKQMAGDKDTGAKWSGQKAPKNHKYSHQVHAFNHGIFYLVKKKVIRPSILKKQKETDNGSKTTPTGVD
jgi:hypothetical protein